MSESYIVIHTGEDGINIQRLDKATLLSRIKENFWGTTEFGSALPPESDPEYWGTRLTIVKGKVVVPQTKLTVVDYEVE